MIETPGALIAGGSWLYKPGAHPTIGPAPEPVRRGNWPGGWRTAGRRARQPCGQRVEPRIFQQAGDLHVRLGRNSPLPAHLCGRWKACCESVGYRPYGELHRSNIPCRPERAAPARERNSH